MVASLGAACSDSGDDDGLVADARPERVSGTELWAQLPTGRITVTVGESVRTIPAEEVADGTEIEADEDRAFLPVAVSYDDLAGVPADAPQDAIDPADLTTVTLRVAGRDYPVPFDGRDDASYVEVEASSQADLALAVEFDGVTQRVDASGERDAGPAAGLYDASAATELASCGEQRDERPDGAQGALLRSCRYLLWEYPYVEGLGWASERESGATWVVVTTQTWLRADQVRVEDRPCRVAAMGGSVAVRVDGRAVAEELPVEANRRAGGHGLGFRGALLRPPAERHELEVSSTWGCRLGERTADREFVDRVSASS